MGKELMLYEMMISEYIRHLFYDLTKASCISEICESSFINSGSCHAVSHLNSPPLAVEMTLTQTGDSEIKSSRFRGDSVPRIKATYCNTYFGLLSKEQTGGVCFVVVHDCP